MDPLVLTALWAVFALMVVGLARAAAMGDAALAETRRTAHPKEPAPTRPPPQLARSGYAAVVLQRVVEHAACALAAPDLRVEVRSGVGDDATILAAAVGPQADRIGARNPLSPLGAEALRSGEARLGNDGVALPLAGGGGVHGVISAFRPAGAPVPGETELRILAAVSDAADRALEHVTHRATLDATLDSQVEALAGTVSARQDLTGGESAALGRVAREAGAILGLEGAALVELDYAARLHGAGKLRIPEAILAKETGLTRDERALVRSHPILAARILAEVPGLEAVALIVRWHTERFDGGGYPDGLAAEQIPLASRIVGACAALGAMLSERPYREPVAPAAAVAELRELAGTQFDPFVVSAIGESGAALDDLLLVPQVSW